MMDPVAILVVVAVIAGLYLAFNIGANDVAKLFFWQLYLNS
jgi:phosphate/sulfate permease